MKKYCKFNQWNFEIMLYIILSFLVINQDRLGEIL